MRNPIKMYDEWVDRMAWDGSFVSFMKVLGSVFLLLFLLVVAIGLIVGAAIGPCVEWKAEQCIDHHGDLKPCKGACVRHQND